MDVLTPEQRHKCMQGNKGKDTKPEMLLRRALRESGFPGYRLQWKVPGRPDIAYPGRRIAIFVNGCFWHRCPLCDLKMPSTNTDYWVSKFEKNTDRDKRNYAKLQSMGWIPIVIWECEIKSNLEKCVDRIVQELIDSEN